MGLKVDCFDGFFHYPVTTVSASMLVDRYPLEKQVCEASQRYRTVI